MHRHPFSFFDPREIDDMRSEVRARVGGGLSMAAVDAIVKARIEVTHKDLHLGWWGVQVTKDGRTSGTQLVFHPNGQVWLEEEYRRGVRHGRATLYNSDGGKLFECEYENGEKHGVGHYWHDNGQLQVTSVWEHGKLVKK